MECLPAGGSGPLDAADIFADAGGPDSGESGASLRIPEKDPLRKTLRNPKL